MLMGLETEGRSPNTRRLARSVLRRALRWAEAEGIVSRNVAAIAHGVRIGAAEGRTLTPDEGRHLLASLDGDRLEAAFTVALSLGLRRGELLGLAWGDIDLDAKPGRLTVRRALKRLPTGLALEDTKTRGSRRTVHLPGPVVVFRTPFGTAIDPDNFRNRCYLVTEAAGLGRWSPHELRHSAASLLLAQGVPLKVVSETLGHASIRITADVYGHLLEPAKTEAAEAMTRSLWR
jgi:integrase